MFVRPETARAICSVLTPLLALLAGFVGLVKGHTWDPVHRRLTARGWLLLTLSGLTAFVSVYSWHAENVISDAKAQRERTDKDAMNAKADATIQQINTENKELHDQLDAASQLLQSSNEKVIDLQHGVISAQAQALELSRSIRISQMDADWIQFDWYITPNRQKKIDAVVNKALGTKRSGASIYVSSGNEGIDRILSLRYAPNLIEDPLARVPGDDDIKDPKLIDSITQDLVPDIWLSSKGSDYRVQFKHSDIIEYDAWRGGKETVRVACKAVSAAFFLQDADVTVVTDPSEISSYMELDAAGNNFKAGATAWFDEATSRKNDFMIGVSSKPFLFHVNFLGEQDLSQRANKTAVGKGPKIPAGPQQIDLLESNQL